MWVRGLHSFDWMMILGLSGQIIFLFHGTMLKVEILMIHYNSLICLTLGQPKIFGVKKPKLHRGLCAKRWVCTNFEHHQKHFCHFPRAQNLAILRQNKLRWLLIGLMWRGKMWSSRAQNWYTYTCLLKSPLSLGFFTWQVLDWSTWHQIVYFKLHYTIALFHIFGKFEGNEFSTQKESKRGLSKNTSSIILLNERYHRIMSVLENENMVKSVK